MKKGKIETALDRLEEHVANVVTDRQRLLEEKRVMLRLLHLYAYPGDFEGRPSKEEIDTEARELVRENLG